MVFDLAFVVPEREIVFQERITICPSRFLFEYPWDTQHVRTLQQLVELLGACRDLDDLCSPLVELSSCGETHGHQFGSFSLRNEVQDK